jgi:hypothetical protein
LIPPWIEALGVLHEANMNWRHLSILFSILSTILLFDAARYSHALDVAIKIIVTREGMPWVLGTTNLPDGSILLISLSRHEAKYARQHSAVVSNRRFTAGPFAQNGAALPPGDYEIEVVFGIARTQPRSVRDIVGENNEKITGSLVREGSIGITARQVVKLNLGGSVSPELDRKAREENEAARK